MNKGVVTTKNADSWVTCGVKELFITRKKLVEY